jgi:hypothetical protein
MSIRCPACRAIGEFSRHGHYRKYFYGEVIQILRVRCRRCRTTHALMPAFSLPGTSIGTEEAEAYLDARERGVGRGTAAKQLLALGMSPRYAKQLDRMLFVAVSRAKGLFAEAADDLLCGLAWIRSTVGVCDRPLWSLNRFCLARRYNCLCFCRASILRFPPGSASRRRSHNRGSPRR